MLKIEIDEDGYRLVGPNAEEGDVADYGQTAEVESGGVLYFTTLGEDDEPEDAEIYQMVDGHPELMSEEHEVEDIEFEFEEEGEEEEGDEAVPA